MELTGWLWWLAVAVGEFLLTLYCKITLPYDMPGCRINAREARHWINLSKPTFAFSPI
jgi:hypothetical protein